MKWFERQGTRFLIAGAANTAIGYALYLLFNLLVDYRIAYSLSFALGIVISFVLNSVYVFRQPLRWARLKLTLSQGLSVFVEYLPLGVSRKQPPATGASSEGPPSYGPWRSPYS